MGEQVTFYSDFMTFQSRKLPKTLFAIFVPSIIYIQFISTLFENIFCHPCVSRLINPGQNSETWL
jgi:hypothetical protein